MNATYQLNKTEANLPYVLFYDREGGFVPSHWHKEIEIVLSLKGGTKIAINNVSHTLEEGEIALAMNGDTHFYFRSQEHERLVIMFALEIFESYISSSGQKRELEKRLKNVARVSSQWSVESKAKVRDILNKLEALNNSQMFGRDLAIRARLYDLVLCLCNEIERDNTQRATLENTSQTKMLLNLEKTFAFIEENYQKNIALEDAASVLGFTPSYFARFFKRYSNTTFLYYLNCFRVSKVQDMLAKTNKPITRIAEDAGFSSVKTFNRVFRSVCGKSPLQYRKSIFEYKEI